MADDELQRCIDRPTPGIELPGTVLEHAPQRKRTARSAQARPLLNDNTLLSSEVAPTLMLARPGLP